MSVPARFASAIARLLLLLYPREFRRDVGARMIADLRDGFAQVSSRAGTGAARLFGVRQLIDLVANLGSEWRHRARRLSRPERVGSGMVSLAQDLRFAARSARRDPRFSVVVVTLVGLGIGAVVTLYGMVEGILIEPLPYPQAERLVSLSETYRVSQSKSVAYPNYIDWRDRNRVFDELAARAWTRLNLTGRSEARVIDAMGVTSNLLPLLGVRPLRGVLFGERQMQERLPVVVVSEGFWSTVLAGSEQAVGTMLVLDGDPFTVIGVVPNAVEYPLLGADLWIPLTTALSANNLTDRTNHPGIEAYGRLRPGVTIADARADLDRVAGELAAEYPDQNAEAGVRARPLRERIVAGADRTLWVLLASVCLVLVGICANVASLMLARATRQGGEMAIRAAIGAGRGRLVRQVLAEGACLALLAGMVGLAGASMTLRTVGRAALLDLPRIGSLGVDATVAGFAVALSLACGLVFAAAPAWRLTRLDPSVALRGAGDRGSAHGIGARPLLVVVQVALAVVLLAGSGLMVRTLDNLASAESGIAPGEVLTAYLGPPQTTYPDNLARVELYDRLIEGVTSLPGVRRVAGGDPLPMSGRNNQSTLSNDGFPQVDDAGLRVEVARVTPGYFDLLGTQRLAGRDFRSDDGEGNPVVIIDESLAALLWSDGEPIGQRLRFRGPAEDRPWHTVVGVVAHVKNYGVRQESRNQLYLPYTLSVWGLSLVVEAEPGVRAPDLVAGVRHELAELDPELPLTSVATMSDYVSASVASERLAAGTLLAFAVAALVVSLVGLYGVVAYSVALRRREFGIRMALGAGDVRLVGDVLREGLAWVAAGVLLGLGGALAGARVLAGLLYGVSATDSLTLLSVAVLTAIVAAIAVVVPARQASRVDPGTALRLR